jgi:hypothetical protein
MNTASLQSERSSPDCARGLVNGPQAPAEKTSCFKPFDDETDVVTVDPKRFESDCWSIPGTPSAKTSKAYSSRTSPVWRYISFERSCTNGGKADLRPFS